MVRFVTKMGIVFKVNGKKVKNMVRVKWYLKMLKLNLHLKVCGRTIYFAKGRFHMLMVTHMLGNGKMTKGMAKVICIIKIKIHIKENGRIIHTMVKVRWNGNKKHITEIGKIIWEMVSGFNIKFQMDYIIWVGGKKIKGMDSELNLRGWSRLHILEYSMKITS